MNTNTLKRFAKEARIKLLAQVGRKMEYVLTQDSAELRGKETEIRQLNKLIATEGKEQVIEMVAYTWFNRFVALRFMDANGYSIPKVLTPLPGMTNPEILQNAMAGTIEPSLKLDHHRLNDLLDGKTASTDAHTEAYKMLLVASCNYWHTAMPFMFERITDYTELLLPDDLLSEYSIIADVRNGMSDEDCSQEEIIGWLYQFYIADKKDSVFDGLKKNIKITAENIPAATQLFTPRWIVRYMVENTLGKLWLTFKPNSKLKEHMPYYIEAPEGNPPAPLPEGIQSITDITFIDPCQGSGHVLVYAFDLFTKIYEEEGYNTNEIPALILQHNLFGIDIDPRAVQLAAFALTMKARGYYSRFLRRPVEPNLLCHVNCDFTDDEITRLVAKGTKKYYQTLTAEHQSHEKSTLITRLHHQLNKENKSITGKKPKKTLPENTFELISAQLKKYADEATICQLLQANEKPTTSIKIAEIQDPQKLSAWIWGLSHHHRARLKYDCECYNQLDNIGSLLLPNPTICEAMQEQLRILNPSDIFEAPYIERLQLALRQSDVLNRKYHCIVTNPPYMGGGGMNETLKSYVELSFEKSKSDLMACFMERCLAFTPVNGKVGMINQHSWMFLSSYEQLRLSLIESVQFETMLHLGSRTFPEIGGEIVQNTAFTFGNYQPISTGVYIRLTDFENAKLKEDKTIEAIVRKKCIWQFYSNQQEFKKIPGSPIGYWLNKSLIALFNSAKPLNEVAPVRKGIDTGKNSLFLREWHEVNFSDLSFLSESRKWFFYVKGGELRKWYGNLNLVVNWQNDGELIREHPSSTIRNQSFFLKPAITWSLTGSKGFAARSVPQNCMFDNNGSSVFPEEKQIEFLISFMNSAVAYKFLQVLNPTIAFQVGDIARLPILYSQLDVNYANECIELSKEEWNSHESSWDFKQNELVKHQKKRLKNSMEEYERFWSSKFLTLHRNEQELNSQIIEIYGMKEELSSEIKFEDITILQEESKIIDGKLIIDPIPVLLQLISYAVGCIFGRYSLDKPGLILANQGETLEDYVRQVTTPSFFPDEDNIIPVLDGEWFSDDIVGRFKVFLRAAFGDEHFDENLRYIEDTIGRDIRSYFVKDFYNDHIKRYKKRPIYWMFTSPKGHFRALIYMHRYQPDVCSKLLNDYLHSFISKLESAKQSQAMYGLREDITAREKIASTKEVERYEAMLRDCREYQQRLFEIATQKISIDLDDGVKVNYQKFKEVVVPIKGLEKEEE